MDIARIRRVIIGLVLTILVLTALEFPPPIGFETRPQDGVSLLWLVLFLTIFLSELAILPILFFRPILAARFGLLAAILNIVQVIADQAHLMQPEVASFGYILLEDLVALVSIGLAYLSYKLIELAQ